MGLQQEIFTAKLQEMAQAYGRMQQRLQIYQSKDLTQIHTACQRLWDECRKQDLLLSRRIHGCRMTSVGALAQAQLSYRQQVEALLTETLQPEMSGKNLTAAEDRAEASSLFAEYAMDFASQAMRYALYAAMQALELQMRAEQGKKQARSVRAHE